MKHSDDLFRKLVETSPDWMWEVDLNAVYTYVSPQCQDILGYSPDELLGRTPFDLMPAQEAERVAAIFQDIVAERRPFKNLENSNLHRDGQAVILETSGTPYFDADGKLLGYRGIDRDITQRREAEQALEVTQQRCQALIDSAPEALVILNTDKALFIDANKKALSLFRMSREQLLQKGPVEVSPKRQFDGSLSIDKAKQHIHETIATGSTTFEWLHFDSHGKVIPCEVRLSRLPSRIGQNLVCGSILDITQHKAALAREASLGRIINNSLNEIYIFDAETLLFIEVNRGARENLGYTLTELQRLTPLDLKPELTKSSFEELLQPLRSHEQEILLFETVHKRKDGTLYNVEVHLQLIFFGVKPAFVAIILDITERIKSREALRKSEENLSVTLNSIGDAVIVTDRQRNIVRMNPVAEQMTGWPLTEARNQNLNTVFHIIDAHSGKNIPNPVDEVFARGEILSLSNDTALLTRNGEAKQIADSAAPIIDQQGNITGVILVFQDVTRQYQIQKALRQSNERFSAFTEAMPNIGFILDEDGRYLEVYGSEKKLLYRQTQQLLGNLISEVLPRTTAQNVLQAIHRTLDSSETQIFEYQLDVPAGAVTFEGHIAVMHTEPGEKRKVVWIARDISQRKQMEEELRTSETRLQEAQHIAQLGSWELLIDSQKLIWSDEIYRIFEIDSNLADLNYQTFLQRVHPEDLFMVQNAYQQSLVNKTSYEIVHRLQMSDGRIKYIQEKCRTFYDSNGQAERSLGTVQDITERKLAELALKESERRFRELFEQLPNIAVQGYDRHGRVIFWNRASSNLYGYQESEALGRHIWDLIIPAAMQDEVQQAIHDFTEQCKPIPAGELHLRRSDGSIMPVFASHIKLVNAHGEAEIYSINIDLTENKRAQAEIEQLAYYDPLTNLPNRRLFLDRLTQEQAAEKRHQQTGAVLFLDLDNFKTLNDALGHRAGDALLQQVGVRMLAQLRKEDTIARLGGDEFVVLLKELDHAPQSAARQAQLVAEKIQAALCLPYQIDRHEHFITTSIGISLFPENNDSPEAILKQADTAMYKAKEAGRNTIRFFHPSMQVAADARLALEKDLRQALQQKQLSLHYQPQLDINGRIIGAEALLRWQHPDKGQISPGRFIPVAEETGLIIPLGKWIVESACQQLKNWQDQGLIDGFHLAVNVSPRQFRQLDFVTLVRNSMQTANIQSRHLTLELTETVVIDNIEDTIEKMQALKAIGVSFSMDDFGTGYSSLAYLRQLPLDQLKIDQTFVQEISNDAQDEIIVETIISMGRLLGLEVIAEGVETADQQQFLARKGCFMYQGYYFGRPVSAQQFTDLLLKRQA